MCEKALLVLHTLFKMKEKRGLEILVLTGMYFLYGNTGIAFRVRGWVSFNLEENPYYPTARSNPRDHTVARPEA